MARIVFTRQLRRFTETPEVEAPVTTLRAALDAAFVANPRLRGYVLDDQGHLRANVVAFIDGRRCTERIKLDDTLLPVPGIHSICPHPTRSRELLVGINCGGAWVSTDDGARWTLQADGMRAAYMPPDQADNPNTQAPHRIVRCAARPDVLWCQHHNGIWRSADNAASWQEVTTAPLANFGFGVAVHPDDADTASRSTPAAHGC